MEGHFVDYFTICGLDTTSGLEHEQYTSRLQGSSSCTPLERSYVAKILGYYPESRAEQQFSHEILALCLPKGLRFCTQKEVPAEPVFHTFVCIKADGARVDGSSLTFYEEVFDTNTLQAMQYLHSMHLRELTSAHQQNGDELSLKPPLPEERSTSKGGSNTLPRRGRSNKSKRTSFYDSTKDKLFVTKCISILTQLPVVGACESILRTLYRLVAQPEPPPLPLESYVYWLLYEIPLPPPGRSLKLTMLTTDVICQRPGITELPFFDYSLRDLFEMISAEKFLKIYTCVLLEHQILLCSKVLQRLMLLAESLTALLFPFRWQHVYVPILPYSQLMFLEAPLPFIMGLLYDDNIPDEVLQSNICLVDIDTGRLELPEDVPVLPDRSELMQELYFILDKYDNRSFNNTSSTLPPNFDNQQNNKSVYEIQNLQPSDNKRSSRLQDYQFQWKRMSRSFDEDSIYASMNTQPPGSETFIQGLPPMVPNRSQLPPLPLNVLHESESLARLTAIAKKAGVDITLEHLQQELESSATYRNSPSCRQYFEEMKLNNAVREIFMNRFVYMLFSYDHFIIGNYRDKDSFANNRDSMQNFDKASYLSDQPESHLPFLSAFIETQMFASFVDSKILSQWEPPDPFLALFDRQLQELRERYGDAMVRTPTYEACPSSALFEDFINKREESLDYEVQRPHALDAEICNKNISSAHIPGIFPIFPPEVFGRPPPISPQKSPWKQRYRNLRKAENAANEKYLAINSSAAKSYRPANLAGMDLRAAEVAQTNWKFVDQLLREAKSKTKRMLVEKMGKEAEALGHADLPGVEENTLVASLCDLIERVWSHGLSKKKGKSALWTHLLALQELEKAAEDGKPPNPTYLTPEEGKPHPVLSYLQGLQKELGSSESGQWSTSLLKAASYLCDKLQSGNQSPSSVVGNAPTPNHNLYIHGATTGSNINNSNNSGSGFMSRLRRTGSSISLSDFSPWTNTSDGSRSHDSREQSPAVRNQLDQQQQQQSSFSANGQQPTSPRKRSLSRPRSPENVGQSMKPLPNHIAYDMRNVVKMTEIKTDIGFARAFVRLALERKLLHKHLRTLLSNHDLLRSLYKRYAFLRCEDEREQFLCHILSLNAADFHCFTNTFGRTKMAYNVMVVPGGGRFTFGSTQPNIWLRVGGNLGQTTSISLTKNSLTLMFEHKNLGILSTLRIGHDTSSSSGSSSIKWYLEYVIIRNEITGRAYKFPCFRWFGRGVDDGSLERLLVAEPIVDNDSQVEGVRGWRTPPRSRSPSAPRRGSGADSSRANRFNDLQHYLGEAVNRIVKHCSNLDKKERSNLTPLLCGERGLVWCLEQAFLMGFRSSKLFRQVYPWDFVEKFAMWCSELLREHPEALKEENKKIMRYCRLLVAKINTNTVVGKDGKFQAFILISIRDHTLPAVISLMASSSVTLTMYDEPCFLRTPQYRLYLTELLLSLNEYHFDLEQSLTWGVET